MKNHLFGIFSILFLEMSSSSTPQTVTPAIPDVFMANGGSEPSSPPVVVEPAGLSVPKFAIRITQPISLNEQIFSVRKSRPVEIHFPSFDAPRADHHAHSTICVIEDVPSEFTESSLTQFLKIPSMFLKFRILSVNENRGRFQTPFVVNSIITIPGIALIKSPRPDVDHMLAYGNKSPVRPITSFQEVLERIYTSLKRGYLPPASTEGQSKFGGGLGRKSASGGIGKFWIRSANGALSEDEWRQRGAVAVDSDGEWTLAKFARIELRDAACDSFIVGIELIAGERFETGISQVITASNESHLVLTENVETESHFRVLRLESLFAQRAVAPVPPTLPAGPNIPPLPLPRSRR